MIRVLVGGPCVPGPVRVCHSVRWPPCMLTKLSISSAPFCSEQRDLPEPEGVLFLFPTGYGWLVGSASAGLLLRRTAAEGGAEN